jgi:4-aminobutyrate aminotransferase-like enzyme
MTMKDHGGQRPPQAGERAGIAHSDSSPEEILALKERYLIPCVYHFYKRPPHLVSSEGVWVLDSEGRRYLDAYSGVTVMSAGHGNREIVDAAFRQASRLQHTTTIYLTEPLVRLAEALAAIAPGALCRSFFCASGSEANEGAMLLASLKTGRSDVLALDHGLHGRTKLAASATGLPMWRTDPWPLETVHFAPAPYCARCPWGLTHPDCGLECVNAVERTIDDAGAHRVAAMILEPVAGNGGIIVPPPKYLPRVATLCRERGILLILDEVQTGFGRTGHWFGCEASGVVPDIMTVAKALGNGFPIAAFITSDEIADTYTRPGASTFGGNPVCCAAALATLAFHQRCGLAERAAELGAWLGQRLEPLAGSPKVLDVRGQGLMWGIELVDAAGEPDPDLCDDILERAKDDGFLIGKTGPGRNVVTLMPPLVVEQAELEPLMDWLETCLC